MTLKITMPKNTSDINGMWSIYYDAKDWLSNKDMIDIFKSKFGAKSGEDVYPKIENMLSYFGLTEWSNSDNKLRKITQYGQELYEALGLNPTISANENKSFEIIINILRTKLFGKDNKSAKTSNSDIEPLALIIRALLDLSYLTSSEATFLLYHLDNNKDYITMRNSLIFYRINNIDIIFLPAGSLSKYDNELPDEARKLKDNKPLIILTNWNFLKKIHINGNQAICINESVLNNFKRSLIDLHIYNTYENNIVHQKEKLLSNSNVSIATDSKNIIYYGVPGVGKSYTINRDFNLDDQNSHRVVFHPDYTYSDFVGQILPHNVKNEKTGEEKLKYIFVPGPFTNALEQAKENPSKDIYLIIEEINRGNAPAIFGDLFQLLDRDDSGESQYKITNFDIAREVYGDENKKVYLPSNLYIIATMNTADQNIFTLDTAFQRRWEMRHIPNKINEAKHSNEQIANSGVSWGAFATVINELIANNNDGFGDLGDKRLGAYFVKNELKDKEKFAGKVLKYLWDDAFKMDREKLFKPEIKMLDEMLEKFGNSGNFDDIFIAEVRKNLKDKNLNFEEKNEPQNSVNDGVIDNSTIDDGGTDESSNEN